MFNVRGLSRFYPVLAAGALLALTACIAGRTPPQEEARFLRFPPDFLWGTATAAYQVEGGITNNWSQAGLDAGKAVEHYQKYASDFALAKQLGTNSHRISIEWARIEPEKGKYDQAAVEHYRQVLRSMREHGLKPMVTLFHFTLPVWFSDKGGWTRDENIQDFLDFTRFIVGELKEDCDLWITHNEPLVYAFKSYDEGTWPPKQQDRGVALEVIKRLVISHGKAYRLIHQIDPQAKVGYAHNVTILQPYWALNPIDQLMTSVQSYIFNEAFWDAIAKGHLELNVPGLPAVQIPYDPDLKGSLDFIGINYYTRYLVKADGKTSTAKDAPLTALGWEIYPDGLLHALRLAGKHAKAMSIPIYITENGLDDPTDKLRPRYILTHLQRVWQAIDEGIPVAGYMYWSLMDNFEWADGFKPKFGLLTANRQLRPSAELYQQIATQNGFDTGLLKQYPGEF